MVRLAGGLAIGGDEPTAIRVRLLVNSAGLYAPTFARAIAGIHFSEYVRDLTRTLFGSYGVEGTAADWSFSRNGFEASSWGTESSWQ